MAKQFYGTLKASQRVAKSIYTELRKKILSPSLMPENVSLNVQGQLQTQ